jgi:hypothetical protein
MFQWESDNKYHRMPEGYILTARATVRRAAITRTPREAYFRWHLPDDSGWDTPTGRVRIPALKMTDTVDYGGNQKKRFSEWAVVARTFDKLLLEKKGIRVPPYPTGEQVASQFQQGFEMHLQEIRDWHPSLKKRRRNRNGDVAKKVSTINTEIRVIGKRKKEMVKQLTTIQNNVWKRQWLRFFVRHVSFYLYEKKLQLEAGK